MKSRILMFLAIFLWVILVLIFPVTLFFWSLRLFTEKFSKTTHRLNEYYVCSYYGDNVVLDNKARFFWFNCSPNDYWNKRNDAIKEVRKKYKNKLIDTTTITLVWRLENSSYKGQVVQKSLFDEFDAYLVTLCNLRNLKDLRKLKRQFERIAAGDRKKFIF